MLHSANKREGKVCALTAVPKKKSGCSHLTRSEMNKLKLSFCTATESCLMDPVQLRARGRTDTVCVYVHGQRLSVCVCAWR